MSIGFKQLNSGKQFKFFNQLEAIISLENIIKKCSSSYISESIEKIVFAVKCEEWNIATVVLSRPKFSIFKKWTKMKRSG